MSKSGLVIVFSIVLGLGASRASAGGIWTDFDGDGLPDAAEPFAAPAGTTVTVDLWIDAQSFDWSNYIVYVEWTPVALSFETADYLIPGGSSFPFDRFSQPNVVGLGGFGFDEGGIDRLASITLNVNEAVTACVVPRISLESPDYSALGNGPAYFLFTSSNGTCFAGEGGACCLPNGVCRIMSAEVCAASGGEYQGANAPCEAGTCPELPAEACCSPEGGCEDLPPSVCVDQGGVPLGPGTSCAADTCPAGLPDAACCFDCACLDRPPHICVALGGVPQEPGTSCKSVQCGDCPTQPCCFVDGSCIDLPPSQCADLGGLPTGNGQFCVPLWCGGPKACCLPDLSCVELPLNFCDAAGGVALLSPLCGQSDCSPYGACCLPDGSCEFGYSNLCARAGGTFYPGTSCEDVECVRFATEPMSWGRVKGLFR